MAPSGDDHPPGPFSVPDELQNLPANADSGEDIPSWQVEEEPPPQEPAFGDDSGYVVSIGSESPEQSADDEEEDEEDVSNLNRIAALLLVSALAVLGAAGFVYLQLQLSQQESVEPVLTAPEQVGGVKVRTRMMNQQEATEAALERRLQELEAQELQQAEAQELQNAEAGEQEATAAPGEVEPASDEIQKADEQDKSLKLKDAFR